LVLGSNPSGPTSFFSFFSSKYFIAYALAFDRFFLWDDWIGAEMKPSASWRGFLRDSLNPVNPAPTDIRAGPVAFCCSPFYLLVRFAFLFS
jgi:hypothetical protein